LRILKSSVTVRRVAIQITDADGNPVTLFSGDNHVVYVHMDGLDPGLYDVNYYSPNSADPSIMNLTWSDFNVDAPVGQLVSLYDLTTYPANPGTWQASVSLAGETGVIATADFDVEESAIPEFPTPVAAILVLGICTVFYAWFRKRAGESLA
jgi:hypothetical protein